MISKSRTLHSRQFREFDASIVEANILATLNAHPERADAKRIARIIDLIKRAEAIEPELLPETRKPHNSGAYQYSSKDRPLYHSGYKFSDPKVEAKHAEYSLLLKELNTILKRYRWSPVFRAYVFLGLDVIWDFNNTKTEQDWENGAILWITRLVQRRIISRLRRCRECGKWYYAMTDHQHYCGEICRKKFASRNEVFKEKRRRYMAEYRRAEKLQSAEARDRVKIKVKQER